VPETSRCSIIFYKNLSVYPLRINKRKNDLKTTIKVKINSIKVVIFMLRYQSVERGNGIIIAFTGHSGAQKPHSSQNSSLR